MKAYRHGSEAVFDFDGSGSFPLSADEGSGRWRDQMGEYVLAEAVLWQAIREYRQLANHRTRREARLFREIDEWFVDNDERWGFSFVNLCRILDLEPSCIRAGLRIWRERDDIFPEDTRFRTVQRKTVSQPKRRRAGGAVRVSPRRGPGARLSARNA